MATLLESQTGVGGFTFHGCEQLAAAVPGASAAIGEEAFLFCSPALTSTVARDACVEQPAAETASSVLTTGHAVAFSSRRANGTILSRRFSAGGVSEKSRNNMVNFSPQEKRGLYGNCAFAMNIWFFLRVLEKTAKPLF